MASKRQELVNAIIAIAKVGRTQEQVSEYIISLALLSTAVLEETLQALQAQQNEALADNVAFRQTLRGQQEEAAREQALYKEAKEIRYWFETHPQYGGNMAARQMNETVFREALPGQLLSVAAMQACLHIPGFVNKLQVTEDGQRRSKLIDDIIAFLSKGNAPDFLAAERKRLAGESTDYLKQRFKYLSNLKSIEYDPSGRKRTPSEVKQFAKQVESQKQTLTATEDLPPTRKVFAKYQPDEQRKIIRKYTADKLNEFWKIQEGRI